MSNAPLIQPCLPFDGPERSRLPTQHLVDGQIHQVQQPQLHQQRIGAPADPSSLRELVAEPPTSWTVAEPHTSWTVAEPPTLRTVAEPPTSWTVAEPPTSWTVAEPP